MTYEVEVTKEIIDDPNVIPESCTLCAIATALTRQDPEPIRIDQDTIFSGPIDDECESYMSPLLMEWHNNYLNTKTANPITIIIDGDICYIKGKEQYDHTTNWKVIPIQGE